jgi:hypothetical protein
MILNKIETNTIFAYNDNKLVDILQTTNDAELSIVCNYLNTHTTAQLFKIIVNTDRFLKIEYEAQDKIKCYPVLQIP